MPLGMEVGLGPGDFVLDGDPANPRKKGTTIPTQLLAHVYCGQTAAWMKTPLGTVVDLGTGHSVLDKVPLVRERGAEQSPFVAHVYCGHGCPSQLLEIQDAKTRQKFPSPHHRTTVTDRQTDRQTTLLGR